MSLHSISEYLDDISLSKRKAKSNSYVSYSKLSTIDNGFVDAQFAPPAQQVPWKSIALATTLLVVGMGLLIFGCLIVSKQIAVEKSDRMWPMILLGCLMVVPGAYHVRIAYYAYNNVPGFSFSDIPEFD